MSLKDEGFRWIFRPTLRDKFAWIHPAEIQEGDVDCTDMGDEEYTCFVEDNT